MNQRSGSASTPKFFNTIRQKQPFFPSRLFDPERTLYALLISGPAPMATPPKRFVADPAIPLGPHIRSRAHGPHPTRAYGGGFGGSQRTDGNAVVGSGDTRSSLAAISVGADYRSDGGEFGGRAGMRMAGGTAQHDFGRYHANAIERIVMEFGSNSAGAPRRIQTDITSSGWLGSNHSSDQKPSTERLRRADRSGEREPRLHVRLQPKGLRRRG